MNESEPFQSEKRISALDGFRGLAILMVTVYRFAEVSLTSDVIGHLPSKLFFIGASGVDFFFVLSGFLITGILLDAKMRSGSYFGRFYYRRSLRIFPLYFAVLFAFFVILPWTFGDSEIIRQLRGDPIHLWLYTMNLQMAWLNDFCYGPFNHFWSLAVEEQYYLVWPVVVFCLQPRTLLRLCMVLLVVLSTARIGFSIAELGPVAEKVFTLFRLDGLLLGSMAAVLVREVPTWQRHITAYRWAGAILLFLFVSTLPLGSNDFTIRFTIVSGVAVALLLATLSAGPTSWEKRLLDNPPMRSLGKYSYAMYMFQLPMIPMFAPWVSPDLLTSQIGSPLLGGVAYVFFMFFLTYALAICSWYGFEVWFLTLRHLWTSHSGPKRAEAVIEAPSQTTSVPAPKFLSNSNREEDALTRTE